MDEEMEKRMSIVSFSIIDGKYTSHVRIGTDSTLRTAIEMYTSALFFEVGLLDNIYWQANIWNSLAELVQQEGFTHYGRPIDVNDVLLSTMIFTDSDYECRTPNIGYKNDYEFTLAFTYGLFSALSHELCLIDNQELRDTIEADIATTIVEELISVAELL